MARSTKSLGKAAPRKFYWVYGWVITTPGTGFQVGDTFSVGTGVRANRAVLSVLTINGGGGITGLQALTRGQYVSPQAAVPPITDINLHGQGAVLNFVYQSGSK